MIILGIILFVVSSMLLFYGIIQLLQKGFLFNNAYIFATKEERNNLNKKPFYIQSGIAFIMISIVFLLDGLYCILEKNYLWIISIMVALLAIIYAIISSYIIYLTTKKKK